MPEPPSASSNQPTVFVTDFDGTVTDLDTGELILTRLSGGDWKRYHEQYLRGDFSFEECLRRQYALVGRTTKASILRLVDEHVKVRPGFEDLLEAARFEGIPVAVASYGLDFCIERVLSRMRDGERVRVYSPKATVGAAGIKLAFTRPLVRGATNLKDGVVGYYKRKGFRVIFAGDGASDLPAVEKADQSYAIGGSELASMCRTKGVGFTTIRNFWPVVQALSR